MNTTKTLIDRNKAFANTYDNGHLPILPKMRSVILACGDARVDPAIILGLELGDAVVIRNNGARVTPAFIEEIATLAFMVSMLDGGTPQTFEVILLQHTQCGAERFADPNFQQVLMEKIGIDVSSVAITDHEESLKEDVERLRAAPEVPNYVVVSGYIYDVSCGKIREVIAPAALQASS